jgi:hypothetical protein|nr:MAG TPA: protein of unknown function DUF859 [Caudoviricetes sp.]
MAINSTYLPTRSGGSLLLTASCNELSYDVATNTSRVQCSIQIQNPNNYTLYSGYSQPYIKMTVHTTSETPGWASWDVGTKYIPNTPAHFDDSIYIEYNVPHKADGTLACSVTASFYANGASASYIPSDGYINSGTVYCTNIPRSSRVDSYTFGVAWDNLYSIKYTKQVASYTHQLRIGIQGGAEIHRVTNYESGTKITLPSTSINKLWDYAADKNNVTVEMSLETYNGSVKIGESTKYTKTFEVNDPLTVTYSIEEVALKPKGVKDNEFITLLGSKRIKVTATCAHSKPKIFIECGGSNKEKLDCISGTQYSFDFTNLTSANYKVYATNQRPNSTVTAVDASGTLINYFKPSIVLAEVSRVNDTASNGFIDLQAITFGGTIGTMTGGNATYTVLKNNARIINESASITNNRLIVKKPISGISYKEKFEFGFQVTDAFGGTSNTVSFNLPITVPVLNYGKKQLDVHHILKLGDDAETGVLAFTKDSGIKYGKLMLDNSNYPSGQNFFKIAEFKYIKGIAYDCLMKVFSGWGLEEIRIRISDDGSKLVQDLNSSYYFGGYRYGLQVLQMNNKGIEIWYHINGGNPTLCDITLEYFQRDTTGSYAYNNIKVLGEFPFAKIPDATPIGKTPGAVYTTALNNKLLMTMPVGTLLYNDSSAFNPIHMFGGSWHKISNVGWRRDS